MKNIDGENEYLGPFVLLKLKVKKTLRFSAMVNIYSLISQKLPCVLLIFHVKHQPKTSLDWSADFPYKTSFSQNCRSAVHPTGSYTGIGKYFQNTLYHNLRWKFSVLMVNRGKFELYHLDKNNFTAIFNAKHPFRSPLPSIIDYSSLAL